MEFHEMLVWAREQHGLSQTRAATNAEMNKGTLCRWEKGTRRPIPDALRHYMAANDFDHSTCVALWRGIGVPEDVLDDGVHDGPLEVA